MKQTFALLLVLLGGTACSGDEVSAHAKEAMSNIENLDLSKLDTGQMKEKLDELAGKLSSKLGEIKDEASAVNVTKAVQPIVGQLNKLKTALGENMPDLGSLKKTVDDLKTRFASDPGIMHALQPLLEKLQGFLK